MSRPEQASDHKGEATVAKRLPPELAHGFKERFPWVFDYLHNEEPSPYEYFDDAHMLIDSVGIPTLMAWAIDRLSVVVPTATRLGGMPTRKDLNEMAETIQGVADELNLYAQQVLDTPEDVIPQMKLPEE